VSPFRSVGARLSLAFACIVVLALAVVWLIAVRPLKEKLVESRVDELVKSGRVLADNFPSERLTIGDRTAVEAWVDNAAIATSARVVVLNLLSADAAQTEFDSGGGVQRPRRDSIALDVAVNQQDRSGVVNWGGTPHAEAAFVVFGPFGDQRTLLFSSSLEPTLANVRLVERRLLAAAIVALFVAVVLGYGAAYLFARRIRRLERAADRIAAGELDEPVVDRGSDEVGELARAFDRMRGRLAQLDHARREFVANASHELRTPIFSLAGFLELLDDEDVDDATRAEFFAEMREQVDRLTRLASDLLDLSRLDAGRLRAEREPVDLGEVVRSLGAEFTPLARASGHEISMQTPVQPVVGLGDELQVLRIGRVLVENALRHTPPGTPIEITVSRRDGSAELQVLDRGPGIPTDHAADVFERFYRAEGSVAAGSGLGLAIARELAQLMDGTVDLDSRPGRTVFTLRLGVATEVPAGELAGAAS
jgi:signal transduction histidine kinase